MIRSFKCKYTQQLFEGQHPRRFKAFERIAIRKLQMLDDASEISDLRGVPGNRLEKLAGTRKGSWSIRINDQWRVGFGWENGDARNVEIVDYH